MIAPLFVGGGSIEGHLRVTVDDVESIRLRKTLSTTRLSVDLLGIEELVAARRKSVFSSLATELFNADNPPPRKMAVRTDAQESKEIQWTLLPSSTLLPFRICLPLDTGPAPFQTRNATIRYLLCATLMIHDATKNYSVRTSQEIIVLSTYDRKWYRICMKFTSNIRRS